MFRTKLAVDRHVQELFRKVKDENERTLRCYNIAKLYFQVEDYESARRYVSSYLEVKGDQAAPHKLLGKIYEALGQKESALSQYKQSLELEPRQDDLVLKVCELLVDMDIGHDVNRVKYWVDRADERFPHHPTVFQLKEKLLTVDKSNGGSEDLEALIAAELSARPSDVHLRVKLLKYYMDKSRLEEAYKHAMEVESTHAHRDSVVWYEALCDLLSKCKDGRQSKWTFWILYVSSLERYAALALKEQGHVVKKSIAEAAQAVFNFDQALTEAKLQNFLNNGNLAEQMFTHMWGQLHYHLACLLLRKTKREQGSWSDTGRLCAPLLLVAMHVQPIDPTSTWALSLKEQTKSQIQLWQKEASYRCSQAGHVLQNYARDDVKRMMDKIDKFCVGTWRERIYQRIFVSKAHIATSYFANHNTPNPPLRLCSTTEMKIYDEVAEDVWPASLHHHVWLGIVNGRSSNRSNIYDDSGPRPHQHCHVFPSLQLSVFNLSQAAPDTLGQLDIDAFLNAAVLCASVVVEEQQRSGFLSPDRLPTLPADITNTLCTCNQEKWWTLAYKIYRKQDEVSSDLGEIRQELQRGLEVVRCIGNHGLHPAILVHLARIFHHRAKLLKEKDKNHSDLPFVEARCELYWSTVVPLLERLLNNQAIRTTSTKLFDYQGKEMNNLELSNALEEGRLLLAQRYIRDKQHEEAIEALQALKCPEASFMQGEIYKSLADELMSNLPKESLTSAMRSQHIVMLSKARGCYYLTLDRLRSPGMNPKHPLNSELGTRIADIENDLKRIDPDVWLGDSNRHECDVMSEESYSSAHSGDQPVIQNSFTGGLGSTIPMGGTPQKCSAHRTPKQASTPCRIQHQDIRELTRKSAQQEARPSPERLDAQIRQLIHSKDNMIQTILDQNKTLLETNKSLVESSKKMNEKIEELQRQFAKFCTDSTAQSRSTRARSVSAGQNNIEDDLYIIGDEDYADLNYGQPQHQSTIQQPQIPANLFLQQQQQQQQQQRNPYSPLVYPQPLQTYYPPAMPFNDPHASHISSLYGGPRVFQMPPFYPRPPLDPALGALPKMAENMQGLFTNRLMNQLGEMVGQPGGHQPLPTPPPQQTPVMPLAAPSQLSMRLQSFDTTRNELPAKDVTPPISQPQMSKETSSSSVSRQPPVNVVITTSDTLPTTVPSVQPTLSVTIPAQYRAASNHVAALPVTSTTSAPHSYQISMPSHAMIPTTVNLPPLSTTITNSISAAVAEQEKNQLKTTSVLSTGGHNYSGESSGEVEHDPLPDFVPVIPLPAEVQVTTGEENEDALFCARAKLYRWSEHEWKERGVGKVKLLKNSEGKVRLVMRREQVLKICANHMLSPDMELTKMTNNERAWIWVANDFADEEVKLEKLCIKFKYVEEAQSFKENFDKAKNSLESVSAKSIEAPNKPETGSIKTDNSKTTVGGFTFSSEPIIQKIPDPMPAKKEETTKPSPFADFSFTKSSSTETPGFSFLKTGVTSATTPDNKTETKSILRRPHAPSPGELAEMGAEIRGTLEENGEALLYEKRATLMRCSGDSGAWKNRGPGTAKIFIDPKTGKIRLFIKRDETGKTFCNYIFSDKSKFTLLPGTDNVVNWNVPESAKGKLEIVACLFENAESAKQFQDFGASLTKKMTNDHVPTSSIRIEGKFVVVAGPRKNSALEKPSLSEIFKPPSDSWECNSCYTRNEASARKCIACEADRLQKTVQPIKTNDSSEKPNLWNQFKPQPESWECQSCYIRNSKENAYCVACNTPKDPTMPPKQKPSGFNLQEPPKHTFTFGVPQKSSEKSLAEMFKPPAGSWECQGCFLRNNETTLHCVSCETPKDPSVLPKQKVSFEPSKPSTFSFGIPQTNAASAPSTGFTFKMPAQEDKSSSGDSKNFSIFGAPKTLGLSTSFSFGIPAAARPSTPPNTTEQTSSGGFAFGSPGKSFDFQFSSKSPTKSPGDRTSKGENSEDEVAESDDIYFAPVIPLPDKVEVKTGEEDEEIVYSHRAKLFRFDSNEKEWKERGLGDIKILRNPETMKLRMLMRRDQTLKLCLNHAVTKELELKAKDDKTWLWNAPDYSEGDIEYLQLACRFKTAQIAQDFRKNLSNALEVATKSDPEPSEPAESLVTANNSARQELEIIYEAKPSAEDKAAALKLQLPENFYAYKLKQDCPGCRGCQEPELPIFEKPKTVTQSPIVAKIAPPKFTGFGNRSSSETSSDSSQKAIPQFGYSEESKISSNFVFGTGAATNGTSGIFSGSDQVAKNNSATSTNFNVENLSICSPTGNQQTPLNSAKQASTPLFGTTNSSGQSSIFGNAANTGISMFGGTATKTAAASETPKESESSAASSPFQNVFGAGGIKSSISGSNPIFPSPFGSQNFGLTGNSTSTGLSIFGGRSATHVFGVPSNVFGQTGSADSDNAFSGFGTASPKQQQQQEIPKDSNSDNGKNPENNEDKTDLTAYLPLTSSVTFETLASQTPANTFKKDPNFSFAGAGATVFGVKSPSLKKIEGAEEEETGAGDEAEEAEHDPHFEPIIPLPDAIEVRTGEEDEDKIFGERAKLYRYESETKEWKERGTGEMKLLYHSGHGTYRLLLRREQVHKVVCNQLVTADLEIRPLHSSDRAWMWAAFNHAEEPFALEELAVKFKNPELANKFKDSVDKAKSDLQERQNTSSQGRVNEADSTECYGEEQDDGDDVGEDEEDEDDEEHSMIFASRADLLILEDNAWKSVGTGNLKILYDSEIYGAKIIVEADNTGEIFSNTVISMETTMEINENCCTWTAIDEVPIPPTRRSLKAVFESSELAQAMYMNFQDGQEYAKQADISEATYYDPRIE